MRCAGGSQKQASGRAVGALVLERAASRFQLQGHWESWASEFKVSVFRRLIWSFEGFWVLRELAFEVSFRVLG